MEKPIKANAMLEDFNKQNPRTQGKPKEIKTRGQDLPQNKRKTSQNQNTLKS